MSSNAAGRVEPTSGLSRVSSEFAGLLRSRVGRGPRHVRTLWAGPDVIVVLLEDSQTPVESTMRAGGLDRQVLETRAALQDVLEREFCELVARHTGREVRTMLSATRLEPDISVEVFLLEPHPGSPDARTELVNRAHRAAADSMREQESTEALAAQSAQALRQARKLGERRGS